MHKTKRSFNSYGTDKYIFAFIFWILIITRITILFRNEQRIQVEQLNKTLAAERNKSAALQNELQKTSDQLTAQKTQAEYANVRVYNYIFNVEYK